MRPSDAYGRSRSSTSDNDDSIYSFHPPTSAPQMSYAIGDESAVDAALEQSLATLHRSQRESRKKHPAEKSEAASSMSGSPPRRREASQARSITDPESSRPVTPLTYKPFGTPLTHAMASPIQPLTPLLGASGPASALSSASSRRSSFVGPLSEDMDSAIQGSVAGDEAMGQESGMLDSGIAPQLVMPSIKMPSRRPFTETGKSMGRLKVMIAGGSGAGKTSLVKAIVQSCEHIVHVDPIAQAGLAASRGSLRQSLRLRKGSKPESATSQISEIYASTKPYPEWWTDLEESRILRRRKSLGDTVLDRNLCFVDTPGFSLTSSVHPTETTDSIVQYVESNLRSLAANSLHDSDLLSLVSGDGGPQIDVLFYLIPDNLRPVDIQLLRNLSPMTNIIPLIAQVDTLTAEQVATRKEDIADQLRQAEIRPFSFSGNTLPYAISCAPGSDHETMDASLLMSPDYVQPLISSDLTQLVSQVFCPDGVSWLRHSAARKFIQWRSSGNLSRPQALYRPLTYSGHGQVDGAGIPTAPVGPASSFALARMTDHTQREERLAQIRLANWAAELQQSLANERARYESVARSERAVWLTERLNECVQDGSLVPVSGEGRRGSNPISGELVRHKVGSRRPSSTKSLQKHQDPLGLLEVTASLKASGWMALEVIGGLGVLGGLAFWMGRQYWSLPTSDKVVHEWTKFWYGDW